MKDSEPLKIEPPIACIGTSYWGKNPESSSGQPLVRNFHALGMLRNMVLSIKEFITCN